MIRKEKSAPSIPFSEAAAQHQQTKGGNAAAGSTITRRPSSLLTSRLPDSLLKPIVSRLPCLQHLPSMPSLRRNLSILKRASTTTTTTDGEATAAADTDWEGNAGDEEEDEEDDQEEGEGEDTRPRNPVNHHNNNSILVNGRAGRNIPSCLRHSDSSKSKKSNKVKFSLASSPPSRNPSRSSSAPKQQQSGTSDGEGESEAGGYSGDRTTSSSSSSKKPRRRRRRSLITSIARPLRSPGLLLLTSSSPTANGSGCGHGHRHHHRHPRPVRIFLEALPLPEKNPSFRASYPHPLLLDLNDLITTTPIPSTSSNNQTNNSQLTTTGSSAAAAAATTAFELLHLAARQTLFYADELLYAPLRRHRYDGASTPVPWSEARLQDLAQGWLRPEDGWDVVFRCEVLPWLGWFPLEYGCGRNGISEEWWDKSVDCGSGGGRGGGGGDKTKTKTKTKKANKTKGKGGKEEEREEGGAWRKKKKEEDQKKKEEGDEDDENWVCFSRKDGVMRIDLTTKFAYRPARLSCPSSG